MFSSRPNIFPPSVCASNSRIARWLRTCSGLDTGVYRNEFIDSSLLSASSCTSSISHPSMTEISKLQLRRFTEAPFAPARCFSSCFHFFSAGWVFHWKQEYHSFLVCLRAIFDGESYQSFIFGRDGDICQSRTVIARKVARREPVSRSANRSPSHSLTARLPRPNLRHEWPRHEECSTQCPSVQNLRGICSRTCLFYLAKDDGDFIGVTELELLARRIDM